MKKVLFIDRDGTLIYESADELIDGFHKLEFMPGVFKAMHRIAQMGYELVMVTNQDGLDTDHLPREKFQPVHDFIMKAFKNEGVVFHDECIDKTFPHENAPTRKPKTGLLGKYINTPEYDLANSFVLGDRYTDVELAKNLGAKAIFIDHGHNMGKAEIESKLEELKDYIVLTTLNWEAIADFLDSKK